jgi:hypothetical protein
MLSVVPLLVALAVSPYVREVTEPVPAELAIAPSAPVVGASIQVDLTAIQALNDVLDVVVSRLEDRPSSRKLLQAKQSGIAPFKALAHDWLDPAQVRTV